MDGPSGARGSRIAAPREEDVASAANKSEQECHDIFVRAHTCVRTPNQRDRRWSPRWPRHCLIFDTETTLDPAQQLNFGSYRRCELVGDKYACVAEGIFYKDDIPENQVKLLQQYKCSPETLPLVEFFPAQTTLGLMTRASFLSVFWKSIRKGELIVGFNLPFDLSRLAISATEGKKGDWSLALSPPWKNPKTGRVIPNPKRPRIIVDAQNSKMAFLKLGSILHPEKWKKEGRFLDLRTLGWALRNVSYNLESACKAFHVEGKLDHTASGRINLAEIEYCRGDVAATHRLLNAMMVEFNQNPIDLHPDKAYSSASIAKAYLKGMNIKRPKEHFRVPNKMLGIAMQSYFGGRAECRIRKTPAPVIHTDFTSQYPTVNALLGNWNVLTSSSIEFPICTFAVKKLLATVTLENTFDKSFWKKLSFFALVKPQDDILPVRTMYNGKTQNIGLNYLTSRRSIWYAGPDIVASTILKGKPPKILKAVRMVPVGRQSGLKPINLMGMVEINPYKDDFYQKVIEQRISHKTKNKGLADLLKVIANSGSYGLFAEVNTETKTKETKVSYFSGEKKGKLESAYVEKPGAWYFPPLASLIISGGRLLLAMLERSVAEKDGSYLFCDTDSLCIRGNEKRRFCPLPGRPISLEKEISNQSAFLGRKVKAIAHFFR
jgi:DNA polymerase type B, organellar and viral